MDLFIFHQICVEIDYTYSYLVYSKFKIHGNLGYTEAERQQKNSQGEKSLTWACIIPGT